MEAVSAALARISSMSPLLLVLSAAAALLLAYVLLSRAAPKPASPALPGPRNGDCKQLFRRLREDAFLRLADQYGPTFSYDGVTASADPVLLRQILLSRPHSIGRSFLYRLLARVMPYSDGILFAADEQWRTRHALFTPLFSGGHVKKFTAHMASSALIVAALHARAAAGGGGPGGSTGSSAGQGAGSGKGGSEEEELHDSGAALLAAAQQKYFPESIGAPRAAPAPGQPLTVGSAGEGAGVDSLTATRWIVMRTLLGWALGLDPDCHGSHPALAAKGYACACQPVKRLARCVDSYARLCFEVMPEAELKGGASWPVTWIGEYVRLWRVARMLRATVADIVELEGVLWAPPASKGPAAAGDLSSGLSNASLAAAHGPCLAGVGGGGGEGDSAHAALSPCPIVAALQAGKAAPSLPLRPAVPADTFLSRMRAAGWTVDAIASEVNHLHGAHKAAAFTANVGLIELSGREDVRQQLREELVRVCGQPLSQAQAAGAQVDPASWLQPLLSHVQATAAADDGSQTPTVGASAAASEPAGGCAFNCGWRVPSKSDLDGGALPIMKRVWKETLRRHVVSMGTMRKLGEPLTVKVAARGQGSGDGAADSTTTSVTLPTGSEMLVLLHAVHHSASSWGPHAHWWLPERWDAGSDYWTGLRAAAAAGGAEAREMEGMGFTVPAVEAGATAATDDGSESEGAATAPVPDLPLSYTTNFFPFLDGVRRCAGMYTAELQFAVYAYAFLVLTDTRVVLPRLPAASADGTTDMVPGSSGAAAAETSVGAGTAAGINGQGTVVARKGALAWIKDSRAPPIPIQLATSGDTGAAATAAVGAGAPVPSRRVHAAATGTPSTGTAGAAPASAAGRQHIRLAVIKRPDMFTGLDGHVPFRVRLL